MNTIAAKAMDREQLFTSVPVRRAVLSLAVPTVISQLITVVYNMADTFFIGQLGDPNQVAAATLAMPLFILLTAFANLFGIGGASMISRCLGAGDRQRARQASAFCIWSAGVLALCYGVLVALGRDALLPLLGADGATTAFCGSYLFWTVGIGAAPTVLSVALAHLIRAEGYSGQASFGVAFGGTALMILCAAPITRCFINDAATVAYGKDFLRIVALACPSTALNFLSITIFQATGRRRQPLILSLLRKGGLDIPLMLLFNRLSGVRGVAWATPIADLVALCVSAALVLPYLKTLSPSNEGKLIP